MLIRQNFFKILLALVLAFFVSKFLVSQVIYPDQPVIRPSFTVKVRQEFKNAVLVLKSLRSKKQKIPPVALIPPWFPPIYLTQGPPRGQPPPVNPLPTTPPSPTIFFPTATPSPRVLPTQPLREPTTTTPRPSVSKVLEEINQERSKVGVGQLSFNDALNRAAQGHAEDMAKRNYFSHTSPEGKTPFQRVVEAGYPTGAVGENIALTPGDPVPLWMSSSGHRANLLNSSWRSAGLGESQGRWVFLGGPL